MDNYAGVEGRGLLIVLRPDVHHVRLQVVAGGGVRVGGRGRSWRVGGGGGGGGGCEVDDRSPDGLRNGMRFNYREAP